MHEAQNLLPHLSFRPWNGRILVGISEFSTCVTDGQTTAGQTHVWIGGGGGVEWRVLSIYTTLYTYHTLQRLWSEDLITLWGAATLSWSYREYYGLLAYTCCVLLYGCLQFSLEPCLLPFPDGRVCLKGVWAFSLLASCYGSSSSDTYWTWTASGHIGAFGSIKVSCKYSTEILATQVYMETVLLYPCSKNLVSGRLLHLSSAGHMPVQAVPQVLLQSLVGINLVTYTWPHWICITISIFNIGITDDQYYQHQSRMNQVTSLHNWKQINHQNSSSITDTLHQIQQDFLPPAWWMKDCWLGLEW